MGKGGGFVHVLLLRGEQVEDGAYAAHREEFEHLRRERRPGLAGRIGSRDESSGHGSSLGGDLRNEEAVGARFDRVSPAGDPPAPAGVGVAQKPAGDVDPSDEERKQADGQTRQERMLVRRQPPVPGHRGGAEGKLHAVDLDGLADACGLSVLPGQTADGIPGNRGHLLDEFRRIAGHVLLERLEGRLGGLPVHLEMPFQDEPSHIGVERLGRVVGGVPDEGLVGLGVTDVQLILSDQIGRIGGFSEEGFVVVPVLVEHQVDHSQDEGGVGARTNRNPLLGPGGGGAANRIHDDLLHLSGPFPRQHAGALHRVVVDHRSVLGAEVENVLAVMGVRGSLEGVVHQEVNRMDVVPAEERRAPRTELGRSESGGESGKKGAP